MQISPAYLRASAFALAGVLLTPALAVAADGEQTPLAIDGAAGKSAEAVSGTGGGGIVRTIVGLAVVIGVIYGLTWVLKQVRSSKQDSAEGAGLETLATLPLGTNRSLHLVRAGDEIVLVGAGEHGVTPIRTYSPAEARALGLIGPEAAAGTAMEILEPEVFGKGDGKPGSRLVNELRRRTVIK
jgi:flagellar protein FliO/FliZ